MYEEARWFSRQLGQSEEQALNKKLQGTIAIPTSSIESAAIHSPTIFPRFCFDARSHQLPPTRQKVNGCERGQTVLEMASMGWPVASNVQKGGQQHTNASSVCRNWRSSADRTGCLKHTRRSTHFQLLCNVLLNASLQIAAAALAKA